MSNDLTQSPAADGKSHESPRGRSWSDWALILARLVVGGGYVYLGLVKVADPVGFLKAIRQYEMVDGSLWLNLTAVVLPWIEVCCGASLLAGVAVRGAALVSLGMLLPFTTVVLRRALQLQAAGSLAFCDVRFDCGCGGGVIAICHKLTENGLLIGLSLLLLLARSRSRRDSQGTAS